MLQVDHVRDDGVVVRCLSGPVRVGNRFSRLDDMAVDLEVTRILMYGRAVDAVGAGLSALVTLRGAAADLLRAGSAEAGWQVLR